MAEKKYSVLAVLKVLQEHSDEEHPLLMKQIKIYVHEEYGIEISEKTIRSDIAALKEFGFDIRNKGSFDRTIEHGDGTVLDSKINKDWYLVGPISDDDIEILFDGLLSERYLPDNRYKEIAKTLEDLSSSVDFVLNIKGAAKVKRDFIDWERLYSNMKIIREAITHRQVISYKSCDPARSGSSWYRDYFFYCSPCRIFKHDGIYYLMGCSESGYLEYIRIEYMSNVQIREGHKFSLAGMIGEGLTLPDFSNRRFKLIPDKSIHITFRFPRSLAEEAADYFGSKSMIFKAGDKDKEYYTALTTVPEKAMIRFVLMYAPDVEILKPEGLRNRVEDIFNKASDKHKGNPDIIDMDKYLEQTSHK